MINWTISQTVDLRNPLKQNHINYGMALMLEGDSNAHVWQITVLDKGKPADLSGCTLMGYMCRADGDTVVIPNGTITGNVCSIPFSEACYAVEGPARGIVRLVTNTATVTLATGAFNMRHGKGDDLVIDPGTPMPSYEQLIAKVAAAEAGLAVERARIDALASLKDGSTTGDAELQDVRIGADGVIYGSAGTAVRTQLDRVSNKIKIKRGKNLFNSEASFEGYLNASGELVMALDWRSSELIDVSGLEAIVCSNETAEAGGRTAYNLMFLCTYDASKKLIAQVYTTGDDSYVIEDGVYYIRFSYHADEVSNLQLEAGTTRTAYEPYKEAQEFSNNETYALKTETATGFEGVAAALEHNMSSSEVSEKSVFELTWDTPYILCGTKTDDFGYPQMVTSGNTVFKVSNKLEIEPFNAYLISASAGYGHLLYAIYDENDQLLRYEIDSTGDGTGSAIEDGIIIAPYQAKYIRLSCYETRAPEANFAKINTIVCKAKPYIGKTWVCVGDSLTEANIRTSKHYHDYISAETGINVVNMGRSGTGYKRTEDEGYAFYQRVANVPADADVVTIFGSGNDLALISNLGSPSDTGTDTICGCVNTTIDKLYAIRPTMRIGIISPTPWVNNQPSDNGSMARYAEALKEICALQGIPFLDLFHCSGFRPNDAVYRNAVFSKDDGNGVHPDENGHAIIAPKIKTFLDTLIL